MKINLLLIEDEADIRDLVKRILPAEEFNLYETSNTRLAHTILANQKIHIILLDWMLPGKSGIDFLLWIKQQPEFSCISIIMLTARAEEENKLKGLYAGADDYITKPFSVDELIARIKSVLRRGSLISPNQKMIVDDIILDLGKRIITINHKLVLLTKIQFDMLTFFMKNPNKVLSRDQIMSQVWGNNNDLLDRTIDSQMRRLRKILKQYNHDDLISTVRGAGYMLNKKN